MAFPHTATVAVLDGSTGLRFDLSARGEKRYYTFRAQALRGSSASGWTNTVFIDAETSTVITAPAAPDSLRAAPGDEEVSLAWEDPLDGAILGYEISYSDDAFDPDNVVLFIVIDNRFGHRLGPFGAPAGNAAGSKDGGKVYVPGGVSFETTAHELAHAPRWSCCRPCGMKRVRKALPCV